MLNTAYERHARPPVPDPPRKAAHADTAVFFGCPDVEGTYAYLRQGGVALDPPVLTSYGFRSVGLLDPDGYALVFHWPATDETIQQWRDWYGPLEEAEQP